MKYFFITLSSILILLSSCVKVHNGSNEYDMPRAISSDTAYQTFADSLHALIQPSPALVPSPAQGLHSIVVAQHGNVVYERYYQDDTPTTFHETYSTGKTLVALAAGLAYDEGKLDLSARVVDFFKDKVPADLPDSMATLTVKQLLTMTAGFEENELLMSVFKPDAAGKDTIDWAKEYFKTISDHRPGTYFYYNLFGTYMMCDILYQLTHEDLVDYLMPRLLEPMHINRIEWEHSPNGICAGGWGAKLCTEDMLKMGQLMLQQGKWNGEQLISAKWMNMMTSKLVDSAPNTILTKNKPGAAHYYPGEMHSEGYGFYVWRGAHNSYRSEGLGSQYVVVLPDYDAVLVIVANTTLANEIFDRVVWPYLLPVLEKNKN